MTPPPVPSEESKILFRDRLIIGSSDDGDDKVRSQLPRPRRMFSALVEESLVFTV